MSALTARDAAAAVAMCLLRTEGADNVASMAFASTFQVHTVDHQGLFMSKWSFQT